MTGVRVTVLTQRYVQGRREFSPVGRGAASDDRGQYRVYGLPPGQYWVSAAQLGGMSPSGDGQGYAPTYYPGTSNVAQAQMVSLALGQEMTGIDYVLVPVRTASVAASRLGPTDWLPLRLGVRMGAAHPHRSRRRAQR